MAMTEMRSPTSSATLDGSVPDDLEPPRALDLSGLPPIYILTAHMAMEKVHEIEEMITNSGANLTYDISEARLVIGKIEQKKRAQLELRAQHLWTEPIEGTIPLREETNAARGPPTKKRRLNPPAEYGNLAVSRDDFVQSNTTAKTPPPIQYSFPQTGRSLPSPVIPIIGERFDSSPQAFGDSVIVLKLQWLEDSFRAGKLLSLLQYMVYQGRPIDEPGAQPRTPKEITVIGNTTSLDEKSPGTPVGNTFSATSILERAKLDTSLSPASRSTGNTLGSHASRSRYIAASYASGHGEKSSSRVTRLLQQTTSEHDGGTSSELPEMPDWVKQHKIYACERASPTTSPNDLFIAELKKIRLARILTADEIGVRAYSTSIASLAAYPYTVTNAREIVNLPGCDVKIANLWIEWKNNNGHIRAVEEFENDEELQVIRLFYEIWGVGEKTAREFYHERGWRDLDDIVEQGWNTLTRVQQIGVKFYDEFLVKIPRSEVELIASKVLEHARRVRDNGVEMCVVGGYRRGKAQSGDVDMILFHRDEKQTLNLVTDIVASLETEGWITHTLTLNLTTSNRGQQTLPYRAQGGGHGFDSLDKALVVWQDPDWPTKAADLAANPKAKNLNIHRRVDIIISPWRTVGCAIAGWTAETTFQRDMRRYATHVKGWKFDSSGVRDRSNGELVDLERVGGICQTWQEAERKVFAGMDLEYREPWERCTG